MKSNSRFKSCSLTYSLKLLICSYLSLFAYHATALDFPAQVSSDIYQLTPEGRSVLYQTWYNTCFIPEEWITDNPNDTRNIYCNNDAGIVDAYIGNIYTMGTDIYGHATIEKHYVPDPAGGRGTVYVTPGSSHISSKVYMGTVDEGRCHVYQNGHCECDGAGSEHYQICSNEFFSLPLYTSFVTAAEANAWDFMNYLQLEGFDAIYSSVPPPVVLPPTTKTYSKNDPVNSIKVDGFNFFVGIFSNDAWESQDKETTADRFCEEKGHGNSESSILENPSPGVLTFLDMTNYWNVTGLSRMELFSSIVCDL
jgi:hypothetical protein